MLVWAEEARGTLPAELAEAFPHLYRQGIPLDEMPAYHFLKEAEEQGSAIVDKEIEEVAVRCAAKLGWLRD